MIKNYNVDIEDNGAAFLVVVNKDSEQRFVVAAFSTLGDAWRHVAWMYGVESQVFSVGKKNMPAPEWVDKMTALGFLV